MFFPDCYSFQDFIGAIKMLATTFFLGRRHACVDMHAHCTTHEVTGDPPGKNVQSLIA